MIKRGSPCVSSRTIRRNLNEVDVFNKVPKFPPKLTPQQKLNRVDWCKKHQKAKFGLWIFTDESLFQLYRGKIGVWCKKRLHQPRKKWNPGLMVWTGISSRVKTFLIKVNGTINSKKYQEIIKKVFQLLDSYIHKISLYRRTSLLSTWRNLPKNSSRNKNWRYILN